MKASFSARGRERATHGLGYPTSAAWSGGLDLLRALAGFGGRASFLSSHLGLGRARHPWRSRVRTRSSNPECHGPYDWRFPRYCNSGAPKALEHCDEGADGSRRVRWLGGACESRVLEEHRDGSKERNRRAARSGGPPRVKTHGASWSCEERDAIAFLDSKVATRTANPRLPWLFE